MAKATDSVRAAIYTRVSTEEQAQPDKTSLAQQREKAEAYCRAQGWEIAGDVYEDAGVSGAKASRPALDRLMADAHQGDFQRVVFLKLDRLGRTLRDLLNISARLDGLGIGIVSLHDSFDTGTPSGRLFFSVLGAVAEFERDLITERMTMGKLGAAKKGHFNTGWTAFGFDYDPESQRLVVNEAEAAVVRRIFGWYIRNGLSQRAIVDRLNAEGVPTKTARVRSPDGVKKGWFRGHVERILRNPMYKGEAYYGKTVVQGNGQTRKKQRRPREEWVPIDCPAIVTEEEWEAAQAKAKRNKRESQRPKDRVSNFILGGLIRCRPCGRPMYGYNHRRRFEKKTYITPYYYCSGMHNYRYQCRAYERVNANKVEGAVLGAIREAFSDPQRVLRACRSYADQLQDEQKKQEGLIATLQGYLANVAVERERLIALCAKGTIREVDLTRQLARLERDAERWTSELTQLEEASQQQEAAKEVEEAVFAIAEQIGPAIADTTVIPVEEQKELVRELVKGVWVDADNTITIECAIPGLLPDRDKAATPVPA